MLYALLVEGRGPLGSMFRADDFTDREVQDTDGDGLPEFVDAWGHPLQFYRWPLLYHSDFQRGQVVVNAANASQLDASGTTYALGSLVLPYGSVFEEREQDPMDVNQQLMALAWWGSNTNTGPGFSLTGTLPNLSGSSASGGVLAFEYFFHRLREPYGGTAGSTPVSPQLWDRAGNLRRAFASKFLIVSSGQDEQLGIFGFYPDQGYPSGPPDATHLLAVENNAMPLAFDLIGNSTINPGTILTDLTVPPFSAAQDDISNQNLQATGGIGGSG